MYLTIRKSLTVALGLPLVLLGCAESPAPATGDTAANDTQALAPATPAADTAGADTAATEPAAAADAAAPAADTAATSGDTVPMTRVQPGTVPAGEPGEPIDVKPLILGDQAPPIQIAAWAKGEPVKEFSKDKVYVVEFWATWCGPCRTSMPHMSTLQEQYGDKVQFIGVTDEDMETVNGFMEQPGAGGEKWSDIIKYAIALDDREGTSNAYMRASNQTGIPTAFIVGRSGRVEWIGHPMGMDDPLQKIVDGAWDVDAAREEFVAAAKEEEALMAAMPALQKAMQSGEFAEAAKVMTGLLEAHPKSERFQMITLQVLLQGGLKDELNKHAAAIIQNFNDKPQNLNQIAWMMATVEDPNKAVDLELALKAATRAAELTEDKDASVLDTVARVYHTQGNLAEAIAWQKKAVAAAPDEKSLAETLAGFEAEAAAAAAPKADEPKADEPKADEPKADEPKAE